MNPTQQAVTATAPAATGSIASASEYEKNVSSLYSTMCDLTRQMVSEEIANPDTLHLVWDYDKLDSDGVIFTNHATAKYTNKSGVEITQPIEASFVVNKEAHSFFLALKMGTSMLYDYRGYIDKNGKIISNQAAFAERGYGELILDDLYNPDTWAKDTSDFENPEPEMTLAEYNAIKTGMTYKEVCKIVGSYGTEMVRSEISGYQTVIVGWSGIGQLGANANITFQNDSVVSKAQMGLN